MDSWLNDCRDSLLCWAISLDRAIGKAQDVVNCWWNERIAVWPDSDQPFPGQPIVERAIDPAVLEQLNRNYRRAAIMTRGRWQ
jgi:hypothetical protein